MAETIQSDLALLEERRDRTNQQITVVRQTLNAVQKGQTRCRKANRYEHRREVFAGFDQSQYETEVRQRWGDDAWERSAKRRDQMTDEGRRADGERSLDVNAALSAAAESNMDPTSDAFQTLVGDHYKWVTEYWNGRKPDRDAYTGLSHLYVTDSRFAATYGGQANAELIRAAIQTWIEESLS